MSFVKRIVALLRWLWARLTPFARDAVERVVWTAAEAVLGFVGAWAANLPAVWAAPFATVLAVVKSLLARRLGNRGTASTVRVT